MKKGMLLPRLALTGIRKNAIVYLPYIFTMAFSVCIYFIFNCISNNKMLDAVPYAEYMKMLMVFGKVLLAIILTPFLFYTNSFLIKRRKTEIGLYSVLGMGKKHTGIMMIFETFFIYVISLVLGLITALIFSKLVFLILLNMSGLPINVTFTIDAGSLLVTVLFFGFVSILNMITNLWQVTKANPVDLLKDPKKGEKEPKHLWISSTLGILFMGAGYGLAILSHMDGFFFLNFFCAIFCIVLGTYFLFTAGSIAFLKRLKKKTGFYYTKENFVTISGMIYRMKKSSASLVNICIFSTMIIITLTCTISLFFGEEGAVQSAYPFDVIHTFADDGNTDFASYEDALDATAKNSHVQMGERIDFLYTSFDAIGNGNEFTKDSNSGWQDEQMRIRCIPLEDYNRMEGKSETLENDEVIVFTSAQDFGYEEIVLLGNTYQVKKEVPSICFVKKEIHSYSDRDLYLVMKTPENTWKVAEKFAPGAVPYRSIRFDIEGAQADKEAFLATMSENCKQYGTVVESENIIDWRYQSMSIDGGLLFIGIFFGLVFTIFLILIMYYKQISEGLEDRQKFHIMQQVGMNSEDVQATIRKQIRLVFLIPLITAILHTFAGLNMTIILLYALKIYNTSLIVYCTVAIMLVFAVFYGVSYKMTARTYYKIIR